MSRPIKISDELYGRLRDQAEAQGLTLQDALVEILTTPHEELAKVVAELRDQRDEPELCARGQVSLAEEIEALRKEMRKLTERIDRLSQIRDKDVSAFNGWTPIWERVGPLEERIKALERTSHNHFWQDAPET